MAEGRFTRVLVQAPTAIDKGMTNLILLFENYSSDSNCSNTIDKGAVELKLKDEFVDFRNYRNWKRK